MAVDGLGRDQGIGRGKRDPLFRGQIREIRSEQVVALGRQDHRETLPQARHQRLVL